MPETAPLRHETSAGMIAASEASCMVRINVTANHTFEGDGEMPLLWYLREVAGLACHYSFGTYVAMVALIRAKPNEALRFEKAVAVAGCGLAVNPNTIEQQVQGSIIFGAAAALKSAITIHDGEVKQSNFHDFEMMRIADAPDIAVHSLPSDSPPGGMGEPALPPVAPAIANAVFKATGKRVCKLPIRVQDIWP